MVAQRIVDVLEAVQIQEQYGQHVRIALRQNKLLGQVFLEAPPVGEPGQFVVQREMLDLLLGAFARMDVLDNAGDRLRVCRRR